MSRDSSIIAGIRQLLENAHYYPHSRGDYLSKATMLAQQISDASIKYQYLDIINRER